MGNESSPIESIKEYYGKILKSTQDLKTNACCSIDSMPRHLAAITQELHPEVRDRFYGCGTPIPFCLEGQSVLDLGCGSGRDCFILSKLVGRRGNVIGVDMTEDQLAVANRHVDYHREKFGYTTSNVHFAKGYIEDLESLGIATNSIDVVVSNCVINLSPDKRRVFSEIFRVLKPGGELYFSDILAGRRVPEPLTKDPLLLGECLGGALYIEDFRRLLLQVGCPDFRIVSRGLVTLNYAELEAKAGMIDFYSVTVRAFKVPLEDRCEDYGQVAYYRGTVTEMPHAFLLDDHHLFRTGRPVPICANTAAMLAQTRYAKHFQIVGDKAVHYGLFDCGPTPAAGGSPCC